MQTVFRIKVSDIDESFIKSIKSLFKKSDEVEIAIQPADDKDETSYLMSTEANRKALDKSLKEAKAGKVIKVNLDALK
jgi:predicted RNA-binding protein with RPS1 domain